MNNQLDNESRCMPCRGTGRTDLTSVTPEMVEAGWEVLRASGLMEPDSEVGKLFLADIFLAMLSKYPASCA